jgi:hypothetical protein
MSTTPDSKLGVAVPSQGAKPTNEKEKLLPQKWGNSNSARGESAFPGKNNRAVYIPARALPSVVRADVISGFFDDATVIPQRHFQTEA